VTSIAIIGACGDLGAEAAWVQARIVANGIERANHRFESLAWTCRAASWDDWYWEAAPLTLVLSEP
jgi:hypothetical protein